MRLRLCPQQRRSDDGLFLIGAQTGRLRAIRPFAERQVRRRANPGSGSSMTAPAVYAEGLRSLWFLASRGVSATWDGSAVVLAPPDPMADDKLEAVLRPDADGRPISSERASGMRRFCERSKRQARGRDKRQWRPAIEGLEYSSSPVGLTKPCASAGRRTNYFVPGLWSHIHLCGAALLIGDREVVGVTPNGFESRLLRARRWPSIASPRSTTASPTVRASSSSVTTPARKSFSCARSRPSSAFTAANNPSADIDEAKAAVLAAIAKAKETA